MIHLILVRHGRRLRRYHGHLDPLDPLNPSAHDEVRARAQDLRRLFQRPSQILTSRHRHARETAWMLAEWFGLSRAWARDAAFLTPLVKPPWYKIHQADWCEICRGQREGHNRQAWHDQADAALREAVAAHGNAETVVVWVGHETRLSQLVVQFTGQRHRQLEALDTVCLDGADVTSFTQGNARMAWRYPVRNWLEAEIKPKLTSKMTVATLLASANFVAMSEILINKPEVLNLEPLKKPTTALFPSLLSELIAWLAAQGILRPGLAPDLDMVAGYMQAIAFLCFGVAAVLFVCTVYLYDRLAMPEGFWTLRPPREANRRSADARDLAALYGAPYFHMVGIWRRVFNPAVAASFLGAFTLVLSLGTVVVVLPFTALFFLALLWYRRHRPSGDVD
jgi:phosphohistidine phosphatase SixA